MKSWFLVRFPPTSWGYMKGRDSTYPIFNRIMKGHPSAFAKGELFSFPGVLRGGGMSERSVEPRTFVILSIDKENSEKLLKEPTPAIENYNFRYNISLYSLYIYIY